MKALYLIDSENVGDFWIPLLDLPDEDTELVVFYTKNSPHMSYDSLIKLKLSDKVVTFIKCYEGTNALDFQLVSELGYRMRGNEEGEFIIVTNDTGYDAAVKYWRKKGFSVRRITGKECKNAAKSRRRTDRAPAARRVSEEKPADMPVEEAAEPVTEEASAAAALRPQETGVSAPEEPLGEETVSETVEAGTEELPAEEQAAEKTEAGGISEPEEEISEPEAESPVTENLSDTAEPENRAEGASFTAPAPEEETNRNAPVAEKKVWNGTGFSIVSEVPEKEPAPVSQEPEETVPEAKAEPEHLPDSPAEAVPEETSGEAVSDIPEPDEQKPDEHPEKEPASKPVPEARAVATVRPARARKSTKEKSEKNSEKNSEKKSEKRNSEKKSEKRQPKEEKSEQGNSEKEQADSAIVVDGNGVSSGEAELKDLTVIVSCVGMDNLAELHNQLIQFYGEGGKQIYQSVKNGSMQIESADWSQHEKYAQYGDLIFRHHGEGEKCPDDFADFIEGAGKKRDNLNSFRYALLKHYGKEKGRKYYFLLKPFMKAINEM